MTNLWLIRHGETDWSRAGMHTGWTDIPLNDAGAAQAREIGRTLAGRSFAAVFSSPLSRALDTCRLAGLAANVVIDPDLREWDYGEYEGRKTVDIRKERPGWSLWSDGVPGGESAAQVAARAAAVIDRALAVDGDVALFAHGHLLRVLATVWIGLPPEDGRRLALSTGSIGKLGWERETRVIERWNRTD